MDEYRWLFRPVVVSVPSDRDAPLARQREAFTASFEGLGERHIVLIEIVGEGVTTVIGPECKWTAADLRAHFGVAADRFSALLVGKDGGVKLRSDEPVSPEELFALIDAMPMRQQEMHRRTGR
jgi:hypothetical protein